VAAAWRRLFRRGPSSTADAASPDAASHNAAHPDTAHPDTVSQRRARPDAEHADTVPAADPAGAISPERLDLALERLRREIPAATEQSSANPPD